MDADLIERLAREAGAKEDGAGQGGAYRELVLCASLEPGDARLRAFKHFAALIAEECAKVCDDMRDRREFPEGWGAVSEACAAAIRAKFAQA